MNVKDVLFTVQKALPPMPEAGSIILNASIVASKGLHANSVYSATKAAVRSFALERILVKHLEGSKNIGPDDFVFCRSDDDPRPHDPDELRRVVLYPVLDRCGIKCTPRADGLHAFRRATSKYLRKASGLEVAAVQLGHKRMTTTDEHYNDRDMDDLKKAAELFFAPDLLRDDERGL